MRTCDPRRPSSAQPESYVERDEQVRRHRDAAFWRACLEHDPGRSFEDGTRTRANQRTRDQEQREARRGQAHGARRPPARASSGAAWWRGRARTALRTGHSRRRPQGSRLPPGPEASPCAAGRPADSLLPLPEPSRLSRAQPTSQSAPPPPARRTQGRARSAGMAPTVRGSRRLAGRFQARRRSLTCRWSWHERPMPSDPRATATR